MKSPFPGMDPYLERRWGDVHTRLCAYISGSLQPSLPRGLRARATEDVLLEDAVDAISIRYEPDIAVVETDPDYLRNDGGSAIATVEPVAIRHLASFEKKRWVEIIDTADGNKVITAIEILSPGNKASGNLNKKYRMKIERYMEADVNVVEIDLIRSSRERLAVSIDQLPPQRRATYITAINRAADPEIWYAYPMKLREPLPTIPIPCRITDADVALSLQPLIDRIYLEGGHDDIDYGKSIDPPFSADDAAWALQLIAAERPGR